MLEEDRHFIGDRIATALRGIGTNESAEPLAHVAVHGGDGPLVTFEQDGDAFELILRPRHMAD